MLVQWEEQVSEPKRPKFKFFKHLSLPIFRNKTNTIKGIILSDWKRAPSTGLINRGDYYKIYHGFSLYFTYLHCMYTNPQVTLEYWFLKVCYNILQSMCGDWVSLSKTPLSSSTRFFYINIKKIK